MANEGKQQVTTQTVESHEEKPKRTRKPRKERAPKEPKGGKGEVELEILDEDEEPLGKDHVRQEGPVITINGDASLRVMTLEEQKANGIKTITGEMGKKCKKAPVVITFKNAKAAEAFFDMCLYAEKEQEEFIDVSGKVEWVGPRMQVQM